LKSKGLSQQSRFSTHRHAILSVRPPPTSMIDVAPSYMSRTVCCVHSRNPRCAMIDLIR
jgi:hypothetical protein